MRTLGALKLSVGTSMALEKDALFQLQTTTAFMVNLRTLVRNVIQSYQTDEKPTEDQLFNDSKSDLGELAKWLSESSGFRVINFIVYYPSYKSLPSLFKKAERVDPEQMKTKRAEEYRLIEKICNRLLATYPKQITKTDSTLPSFVGKGLIITHHVVDLTLTSAVTRLKLLESYTGVIKPYTQWYTKLTGGTELHFIPFNKLTIQIFGDRSTNFYSSSKAIKDLTVQLAHNKKWSSGTSFSKVKSDINSMPRSITREGLKLLF